VRQRQTGTVTDPGDRQLVRERTLDAVRSAISDGQLVPGSRLTERQLCETYAISRTLAREVVRQLESERLIDVVAHRGLRIAQLTRQRVREIYAVRTELEVLVVRSYVEAATPEDIDRLCAIYADLRAAGDAHELDRIVREVTRLLWHMIDVANAQVAGDILKQLVARVNMLRFMSMNMPGQIALSMVQIEQTVDRIAARDARGAEAAIRVYVEEAGRSAIRYFDAQGATDRPS
jgi:DNA-binding GntR family transcriptional regulator